MSIKIRVKELLDSIQEQYRVVGSIDRYVESADPITQANNHSVSFSKDKSERAYEMIRNSKAAVIICANNLTFSEEEFGNKTLIQVVNPRLTFSRLLAYFFLTKTEPVIHSTAVIDKLSIIGRNVSIGAYSYIGESEIGDDTIIDGHVYIHPGTKIGKRVIIHAGVVIGTPATAFERNPQGELEAFPQISGVTIEDNVEIGANSIICRGSLNNTLIGQGTKIDALVHVAHGVRIGKHCIVLAGTILCGSVKIGDQTWIGPQACIREGGIIIGNRVTVGAGSVVHKDVIDDSVVTGSPARPITQAWTKQRNL